MARFLENHLNESGQSFLAFDFTRIYGSAIVEGKRGSSDETRFRAIFQETVPRCYAAFLAFLQVSPDALATLRSLNNRERMTTLNAVAVAQVHLLSTLTDKPLLLTWPAPMQSSEAL